MFNLLAIIANKLLFICLYVPPSRSLRCAPLMDHATAAAEATEAAAATQGVTQLKHTLNLLNNHANLAQQLSTLRGN